MNENEQMIAWAKKRLAEGATYAQVRKEAEGAGYSESDIAESLSDAGGTPAPQAAPPAAKLPGPAVGQVVLILVVALAVIAVLAYFLFLQ